MRSKGAMTGMYALVAKSRLLGKRRLLGKSGLLSRSRPLGLTVLVVGALAVLPGVAQAAQFGIASFSTSASSTQAGAHADYTTAFSLNTDALGNPIDQLKNLQFALPSGVVGDPQAIERCSDEEFQNFNCPSDAQVGVVNASLVVCKGVSTTLSAQAEAGAMTVDVANGAELCGDAPENTITVGSGAGTETANIAYVNGNELTLEAPLANTHPAGETLTHVAVPETVPAALFNMQPSPGHVATFAASVLVGTIVLQADVRKDGSYGLDATVNDLTTFITVQGASTTLWGVPADPSHDAQRCGELGLSCGASGAAPAAFMVNPTNCAAGPLQSTLTVESWQGHSAVASASEPAVTGCEALSMAPTLTVTPETTQADTPTGYDIDIHNPQSSDPYGTATPALKNVSLTLPVGTAISAGVANGLQGCSDEQLAAESCPDAAKVGSVEVTTPLLADRLTGAIYVGTPTPSQMYRLFLLVSGDNVTAKLTGRVEPDPLTGQLTVVFEENPQVPLSDIDVKMFGGPDAALSNPQACGPATSSAQISSYAGQTASPTSTFVVDSNGQGGSCPASAPFGPGFSAGTTSPLAGGFSPFTLTISRTDGQQDISAITTQLPPGLLAVLKSVVPCPEPQASQGACGPESLVGHTTVGAGGGSEPFYLGGQVFLTGPYKGAPYGLSIVVPAIAGPFNLGTVIVRASVAVDPHTAQVTVTSDPLPRILDGVPVDLQTVNVTIDRAGFIFNPTNCSRLSVNGTILSTQGVAATVSEPFQAADCAALPFHPSFTVSTQARTSKANGASLDVKVGSGAGQANIAKVAVSLPIQLPSRLQTIQQACTEAVFAANPASCPAGSDIGTGTAVTPLLAGQLKGPAYLVSHGGAAFPDIVVILQGEGVTLELTGKIDIKGKVTSSAFESVPDAPVTSFELSLPEGPHSALATNIPASAKGDLCGQSLTMPTTLTGQNGAQIEQTTKIALAGCPKIKKAAKKKKHKTKPRHTKRSGPKKGSGKQGK
jgi:hypothetical protein